jgi:two-component system sensor histidine kinase YesM
LVFLSSYRQQILKESQLLIDNTLTSVSQNISSYLYELQSLSELVYFDNKILSAFGNAPDNLKPTTGKVQSAELLAYLKKVNRDILSIVIINNSGSLLYANRNSNVRLRDNYHFGDQGWYQKLVQKDDARLFLGSHRPDYFTFSSNRSVFSVARTFNYPSLHKKPAVILADADATIFHNLLANLTFRDASVKLILGEKADVIFSTSPVSNNILKQLKMNSPYIKDNKKTYNVFFKNIVPSNWKIVVLVSDHALQKEMRGILYWGVAFAFLTIAFTSLIFIILSKQIVGSFEEVTAVMKQVKMGNLNVKCSVKGHDEIAVLKNSLNSMITKLDDLITKEYRLTLSRRNAEYKALQSQIQPHFLYNTLNGFLGLNRLGKRKLLENSILNLTAMLRYTLGNEDLATVKQELDFLNQYCELQKMRFADRMSVRIAYHEAIKNFKIPKLLLQPLIENFIFYVVEPSDQPKTISITADKITVDGQSHVNIRIDDDGEGFEPNKSSEKGGIGLANVQERLKLTYPASSFSIISAPDCGTHIDIKITVKEGPADENLNCR